MLLTWHKLFMISNTKKQRKMIADITSLWIDQYVPAELRYIPSRMHVSRLVVHISKHANKILLQDKICLLISPQRKSIGLIHPIASQILTCIDSLA